MNEKKSVSAREKETKFCCMCRDRIMDSFWWKCSTCKFNYYMCESCEYQGKAKWHGEGKHTLLKMPPPLVAAVSTSRNAREFDNCEIRNGDCLGKRCRHRPKCENLTIAKYLAKMETVW